MPIFKKQVALVSGHQGGTCPQTALDQGDDEWRCQGSTITAINGNGPKNGDPWRPWQVETMIAGSVCCCLLHLDVGICSEVDEVDGPLWIFVSLMRPNNLVITRNRSRAFGAMKSWKSLGVTCPFRGVPHQPGGGLETSTRRGAVWSFRWTMEFQRQLAKKG